MKSKGKGLDKIKRIVLESLQDEEQIKSRSESDAWMLFSDNEILKEQFVNEANSNKYTVDSDIYDYDFCSYSKEFIKLNSTKILGVYIEPFHNYTQNYICLYEKAPDGEYKYKVGRCYDDYYRNIIDEFIKEYNIIL